MTPPPSDEYYSSRSYHWFWLWHVLFDGTRLCRCERSRWTADMTLRQRGF